MTRALITADRIAQKYNVPYSTVNHYTIIGLLKVVNKRKNVRLYDEAEVRHKLKRILELKEKGYPLSLIKSNL